MPFYKCTLINDRGERIVRQLEAGSKREVWERHQSAQLLLLRVKRVFPLNVDLKAQLSHRIKANDFYLFNQKLIALINAGVPLVAALATVLENTPAGALRVKMEKARESLQRGVSLREAFAIPSLPYSQIYKGTLTAGERSGQLEALLRRFNAYLSKMVALRRRIISSLSYPIFVLSFVIVLAFLIIMVVVPKFSRFFTGFNSSLPPVTQFVINLGEYAKVTVPLFVGLLIGGYLSARLIEKRSPSKVILDRLKLKVPLIGQFIVENALAAFSRTLAILLSAGIPLPESLGVAIETFGNKKLRKDLEPMRTQISEGQLLSQLMAKVPWMRGMLLELTRVGEGSGNLGLVLEEAADHFEAKLDSRVASLVSMIEPILLAIISLLVGLVIFSVYLPIFSSVQVIR